MNSFHEKSIHNYNEIADHYDDTFDGRFTLRFKQLILEEISIGTGAHVLDVACGNGTLIGMLSDRFGIIGYGADISEKMIENASARYPEMAFRTAGCEALPFEDNRFDLVTVCAAYHHFPDIRAFAVEAHRLLKENGALCIADVYYPPLIRWILNPFMPLSKAGDVKIYSPGEIKKTFEAQGFRRTGMRIDGHIQIHTFQKG